MDTNDANTQNNNNAQLPNQQSQRQRKKCHGNRRDQRFRRKCRDQKMQPAKIEKLIKKRNRLNKKNQRNNHHGTNRINNNMQQQTTVTNFNKRKRDISLQQLSKEATSANQTVTKSLSQLSIEPQSSLASPSSKKMKNITTTTTQTIINPIIESDNTNTNININYRYVFEISLS
jgi:hypothetical protein